MEEQDYTIDDLHEAFRAYLMGKFDGESNIVDLYVETAERIIPNTLNDYFGLQLDSIYDLRDGEAVDGLRKRIKAHPVLRNLDMSVEPRYTEVLRWYRLFLRAVNTQAIPIPVHGEQATADAGNFAQEKAPAATTQTTIFVEGEAELQQPKEIRLRNRQLRQACMDYYRSLHGGHLVCECCGFDFSRAYAISDEYIEIHHLHPFAQTDGPHPVNALTDLVPLCANCHRMIHHGQGGNGNCMTLEQLKAIYRGIRYDNKQMI